MIAHRNLLKCIREILVINEDIEFTLIYDIINIYIGGLKDMSPAAAAFNAASDISFIYNTSMADNLRILNTIINNEIIEVL